MKNLRLSRRFFSRWLWIPCALLAASSIALAAADTDDIQASFSRWEQLRNPDAPAIRFEDGYRFLTANKNWPEEKLIRLRTEAAAMNDRPGAEVLKAFCDAFPPISGRGMIACARVGDGDEKALRATLTKAWVQGDFNEDEENRILQAYGEVFSKADHLKRLDRLLFEGKSAPAKRMIQRMPALSDATVTTRLAFINDEPNAPRLLNDLSPAQLRSPGVVYERLRYRIRYDADELSELLVTLPKDVPYPDLWWPIRARAAREAMQENRDELALILIEHHGDLKPDALAEALWLKGWILLRHRKEPGAAYKQFFKLYTTVSTPVSKSRAAYWAARAASANGNPEIAKEWLEKAARHPTVFYGQLARLKLKSETKLTLPDNPTPTKEQRAAFAKNPLVRVIRALPRDVDEKMRDQFINALGGSLTKAGEFELLASLAQEIGGTATGVEAAKLALRNEVVLIDQGWPRVKLPSDLTIEPALTLAIIRQESQFDPTAKSSAGAMGMMQLLPSTAKQVAKRADISFSKSLLNEPATNILLGSRYLGQRIDAFDGSYILGIASYNAGIGNVRKWEKIYGRPPQNLDGAIDWIESIPFGETRNYVMRVLENVGVYRTVIDPDTKLTLDKDIVR